MSLQKKGLIEGTSVAAALLLLLAVFGIFGLFAYWAWTWSVHTLVWAIFIFGSVLGGIRVKTG